MKQNLKNEIESCFSSITLPDRRDIVKWTERNVNLPSPPYAYAGALDLSISRYLIEPLKALGDHKVREVVCCASPRTGKTLIADAFIVYLVQKDPADILVCFHTKEVLKSYYDVRFLKFLQHNNLIPADAERFDTTQKLIRLPSSTIRLISVQNPNSLTALGSRVVIADECWRYPVGSGIISQIKNRTLDYRYSKKQLFISQACEEGHEFHVEFKQGHQAHWGFVCPSCNTTQKYVLNYKRKNNTYAGLTWDTNDFTKPNGIRDIPKTIQTVRYECIQCGQKFFDTDKERRLLNNAGLYITENPGANPEIKSFSWNAFACNSIAYSSIAETYLVAKHEKQRSKGDKYKNFFMQEMSQFWNEGIGLEKFELKVGMTEEESDPHHKLIRFLTCDVQQGGNLLYYVVVEFNKDLKWIKLVTYGKTDGFESLYKIQRENAVKDQNVLVDSGDQTRAVYRECSKHGHSDGAGKWYCWTSTKGEAPKNNSYFNPVTKKNTFFSRPKLMDGNVGIDGKKKYCPFITFSNKTSKDILKALLDNTHPDYKLYMNEAALNDEEFKAQINSEHVDYKNGIGTWVLNKDNSDNHYWDCLVLCVVAGGVIGQL
jgi:phage terminase large subunit GpA-like protein